MPPTTSTGSDPLNAARDDLYNSDYNDTIAEYQFQKKMNHLNNFRDEISASAIH